VKFKTFAEWRIRGAMLDYLRQLDPLPRAVRRFQKCRTTTMARMSIRSAAQPTDDAIACEMGMKLEKYRKLAMIALASDPLSHLRSTYATRLSAGGVADEFVTQLLRQGDRRPSGLRRRFAFLGAEATASDVAPFFTAAHLLRCASATRFLAATLIVRRPFAGLTETDSELAPLNIPLSCMICSLIRRFLASKPSMAA
jgi:hypothetical protein